MRALIIWKWSQGCKRRVGVVLTEGWQKKSSCSITRIYTQLHAFTQCSWRLTLRGLKPDKSASFACLGIWPKTPGRRPTLPGGGREAGASGWLKVLKWAEAGA